MTAPFIERKIEKHGLNVFSSKRNNTFNF